MQVSLRRKGVRRAIGQITRQDPDFFRPFVSGAYNIPSRSVSRVSVLNDSFILIKRKARRTRRQDAKCWKNECTTNRTVGIVVPACKRRKNHRKNKNKTTTSSGFEISSAVRQRDTRMFANTQPVATISSSRNMGIICWGEPRQWVTIQQKKSQANEYALLTDTVRVNQITHRRAMEVVTTKNRHAQHTPLRVVGTLLCAAFDLRERFVFANAHTNKTPAAGPPGWNSPLFLSLRCFSTALIGQR